MARTREIAVMSDWSERLERFESGDIVQCVDPGDNSGIKLNNYYIVDRVIQDTGVPNYWMVYVLDPMTLCCVDFCFTKRFRLIKSET